MPSQDRKLISFFKGNDPVSLPQRRGFTRQNFSKKNLGGFTLIELLIVIAIISILSSIGFAAFRIAQRNARDQRRIQDLNQVKVALEQFFDIELQYPESGTGVDAGEIKCPGGPSIDWGTALTCASHTYMRAIPEDPTGATQYCFTSAGPDNFTLYAAMENDNNRNYPAPNDICEGEEYNYRLTNEL